MSGVGKKGKRIRIAPKQLAILLFVLGNKDKDDFLKPEIPNEQIRFNNKYTRFGGKPKTRMSEEREREKIYLDLLKKSLNVPFITPIKLIKKRFNQREATVYQNLDLLEGLNVLKKKGDTYYADESCIVPLLKNLARNKAISKFKETEYYHQLKSKIELRITKELEFHMTSANSIPKESKEEWIKENSEDIEDEIYGHHQSVSLPMIMGFEAILDDNDILLDLFDKCEKLDKMTETFNQIKHGVVIDFLSPETANKFLSDCFKITRQIKSCQEPDYDFERELYDLFMNMAKDMDSYKKQAKEKKDYLKRLKPEEPSQKSQNDKV